MTTFQARRHRLQLPSPPSSDDPDVLKGHIEDMRRLVQDEFNRLSTDFYDFRLATYNAAVIPLPGVANISVTKDRYSMSATWENPDASNPTPTHIRLRIKEITPNSWAEFSFPKDSWEFNGLDPNTQYTLEIQLIARFEATETFVSTTRNCPSLPVLRTAESDIRAKVFTTDPGVSPPSDPGTNDDHVDFNFPDTDGTPGTAGGGDCYWGYQFQYSANCAWTDIGSETEVDGDVGDVNIGTADAPFSSYTSATRFRMKFREKCNAGATIGDWDYTPWFVPVDWSDADCLGIPKSASRAEEPYSTADLFVLPGVCCEDDAWGQITEELSDTVFTPQEPGFGCIEYQDSEWTLIGADTTNPGPPTARIFQPILTGTVPALANFNAETDFTIAFDIYIPDDALSESQSVYAPGGGGFGVPILNVGEKIKVYLIANTQIIGYRLLVQVPRDGGGAYEFSTDYLAYAEWNNLYYVHDVSEADGRILYANGTETDRSANAIANDFNGITTDVRVGTVNEMKIRKICMWDEAVPAEAIAEANELYLNAFYGTGTGTDITNPPTLNVNVGDVVFALSVTRDNITSATASAPSGFTGTATLSAWSTVAASSRFDTSGVSDGASGVYAAVVTAAGTIATLSSPNAGGRLGYVVVPGLETASATDVTQAFGTVTTTKATEASQSGSATPGAATGGGYRLLTFVGGGGGYDVADAGDNGANGSVADYAPQFSTKPFGQLSKINGFSVSSAYTGFTACFASSAAYSTATQSFTISKPGAASTGTSSMASGGFNIHQVELVQD